jgi:hypothetical protein
MNPPSGWGSVPLVNWQGWGSHAIFYKVIDGTEANTASYSVTPVVNNVGMSMAWLVSGADTATPVEDHNSTDAGTVTVVTLGGVDTLGSDRLVIAVGSYNPGASFGDYFVWADGTEFIEGNSGTNRTLGGASLELASAGASGSFQYTQATSAAGGGAVIAIPPAATGVSGPLPPSTEISRINLTGPLSNIQDSPLSPDANFLTGPQSN